MKLPDPTDLVDKNLLNFCIQKASEFLIPVAYPADALKFQTIWHDIYSSTVVTPILP